MTKLPPTLCVVILKGPVKFGLVVVAELLALPPPLPGPDFHCQAVVRIDLKVSLHWN